jgi:hypothetical protein
MARARARPCRPDAAGRGMPGGGSAADERAWRGEREGDRWDPAADFILN